VLDEERRGRRGSLSVWSRVRRKKEEKDGEDGERRERSRKVLVAPGNPLQASSFFVEGPVFTKKGLLLFSHRFGRIGQPMRSKWEGEMLSERSRRSSSLRYALSTWAKPVRDGQPHGREAVDRRQQLISLEFGRFCRSIRFLPSQSSIKKLVQPLFRAKWHSVRAGVKSFSSEMGPLHSQKPFTRRTIEWRSKPLTAVRGSSLVASTTKNSLENKSTLLAASI